MSSTVTRSSNTLVHHGDPIKLRKCEYTGHATTIYSVDHAISVLDEIGELFDSDDCLPFALRMVEGSELIQLADDNGEFGASQIISSCLGKLDGYNILVTVTVKINGCFNPDMVQNRKLPVIRTAALNVIEHMRNHLENRGQSVNESTISEVPPERPRAQNSQSSQPPPVPFDEPPAVAPQQAQQRDENGENLRFESQVAFTETDLELGATPKRGNTPSTPRETELNLGLDGTPTASPAQLQGKSKRPVDPLGAGSGKKHSSKAKFGAKLPRAPKR
jgi:hypothetical protein